METRIYLEPLREPPVLSGGLPAETYADEASYSRIALSGHDWLFAFDHRDRGIREHWYRPEYRWERERPWSLIPVPGTWDRDVLGGFDRQTVAWYRRTFVAPARPDRLLKLCFDGVFREAVVWLNGTALGRQAVPYVPFQYDVTGHVRPGAENTLVVRIDDRIGLLTLPCANIFTHRKHGWFPYGGITRPVAVQVRLPRYVAQVYIDPEPATGAVTASVLLDDRSTSLPLGPPPEGYRLRAWITAAADAAPILRWPEQPLPAGPVRCVLEGTLSDPACWSPENPENVYRLHLELTAGEGHTETCAYRFAYRTFEARDTRFFLNGTDLFLRGMNRHEDHPVHGPVFDPDAMDAEVQQLKALHVNFVRPGHYPVDVRVLRSLEDAGIMVVEEIPVYQLNTLQLASPTLRRLAREALETMIVRDYNRPGVVMWSVCNEIHPWFPAASSFVRGLYRRVRALNPARPVMLARVTWPFPLDLLNVFDSVCGEVDAVGLNEYVGWYFGKTTGVARVLDAVRKRHPEKTWFISEYGADALLGRHNSAEPVEEPSRDHSYTEEYQVFFHRKHREHFLRCEYIRGAMPWVLSDFRMEWAPWTGKPHPVRLMNLKGLTSYDRRPKALFNDVAAFYREIAFSEKAAGPVPLRSSPEQATNLS